MLKYLLSFHETALNRLLGDDNYYCWKINFKVKPDGHSDCLVENVNCGVISLKSVDRLAKMLTAALPLDITVKVLEP